MCHRAQRSLVEAQLHFLELEELGVLLGERVFRLFENADERVFVERFQRHHYGQTTNELGDQPITQQVVRLDLGERILLLLGGLARINT